MGTSSYILFFCGGCLLILAALGALKLPDTLTRMAAVTKASTLGVIFFCLAGAVHFKDAETTLMMVASAIVLALGIPLSSHLMARSRVRRRAEEAPLFLQRNDLDDKN